ncbi:MAG: T9SS type A sorting domain-containing protein, partial [Bacteroidota bacterium]
FIEVIRDNPDGGTVAMPSGATTRYTCPGDGIDDIVEFTRSTSSLANYAYVVTDDNNIILGLPPGNSLNFEGAGTGVCRVWGLSYTGMVTAQVGDDAAAVALSSDCFDLSDNFIEVIRDNPDGGTVAMPSGATTRYTCPGDGIDDIVEFTRNTSSLANYAYVVTDDNNIILGLPPGNSLNFEGAGTGVCRVWGLSYTGMVTAQVGDDAAAVALSSDCFDLSDNFIEVIRDNPDGGTVEMPDGNTEITTCAGDGEDDIVEFTHATGSLANYTYVITDDNNIILGLPPGNSQNFEGAGTGVCRVWGLSYTGMITAEVGDDAAAVDLSSDCFELSENFITVNREDCFNFTDPNSERLVLTNQVFVQPEVQLSPNPASDYLRLTFEHEFAAEDNAVVAIYSLEGRLLFQQNIAVNEGYNNTEIQLTQLPEGLYILRLRGNNLELSKRFVKN